MNYDGSRRFSATTRDAIPAAPPLPAPRSFQRARDAANRFFGYQSRSASPQNSPEEDRQLSRRVSRYASLGATQNATVAHKTGLEINTLSINEKGTHALLGGKEIFKTVKVEDGVCVEDLNLRSRIRSTPTQASGQARQVYSIDIADVAWAKGDCGDYVAAATRSGKIILYDLGHAGLQAAQLHEHFRQVHRVTFNPHRGSLLLSGSQDGTVRLWDVRDVRQASTLQSKRKYSGQSDGVRDVKWSPTEGVDFAFGTDSGWIQRWDIRNLKTAKVKVPAHGSTCHSIDWHPDGKHIASASADKTVRIWDFSGLHRQQKALLELKTPYRVSNARWRPSCESATGPNNDRQCTQIVTAYDQEHTVLHVWDVRRPALPFRELFPHGSAPTDLLWHSQDLLWTVNKDGTFLQTDIQHAPKPIDKRNLQAFALSPLGDISFITQKRLRKPPSAARHIRDTFTSHTSSSSHSPQRDGMLGRSWEDDGLDHSFLRTKPKNENASYEYGLTRASSIVSATSSNENMLATTINLDEVLANSRSLRPRQISGHGQLPCAPDPQIFTFLANNYQIDLSLVPGEELFEDTLTRCLDHNARIATAAGLYRTAQTWKIVRFSMMNHLKKRADAKQKRRVGHTPFIQTPADNKRLSDIAKSIFHEDAHSPISSPLSLMPVSNITQRLAVSDIASDRATPLARPTVIGTASPPPNSNVLKTSPTTALSPSATNLVELDNDVKDATNQASRLTTSNLDGLQKLQRTTDVIDRDAMVRRWSIQHKEPLNLDPIDANGIKIQVPKLQRQGSNESFTFLDGSLNSRESSFPSSYDSKGTGPLDMVASRPSRAFGKPSELDSVEVVGNGFDEGSISTQDVPTPQTEAMSARPHIPAPLDNNLLPNKHKSEIEKETKSTADQAQSNGGVNVAQRAELTLSQRAIGRNQDASKSPHTAKIDSCAREGRQVRGFESDSDEGVEESYPFKMVEMLQELTSYYASKGDAQTAVHLIVLLAPFLPRTQSLPDSELVSIVAVYVDYFTSAGFTQLETNDILDVHFEPLVNAGLHPLQIEAILSNYHEQLLTHQMWNEAVLLRRLSYPTYPSVYEDAVKDNYLPLRCGASHKPLSAAASDKLRCVNCRVKPITCPICWCDESPYAEDSGPSPNRYSKLMTTCMLCNHSSHMLCLRVVFEGDDDGGCPTEGCLCDCVSGSWRDEKARLVEAEKSRRARGHNRVKSDELAVTESDAVGRAREVLQSETNGGIGLGLTG